MYVLDLRIKNLKLLRDFRLSFGSAEKPRMFTVMIGENGTCKTAILRAIAMAAVGPTRANQLASVASLRDRRLTKGELEVASIFSFSEINHEVRTYPQKTSPKHPPRIESQVLIRANENTLMGSSRYTSRTLAGLFSDENPIEQASSHRLKHWFVAGYGTSRQLPRQFISEPPKDYSRVRLGSLFDQGTMIGTNFSALLREHEFFNETLRQAIRLSEDLLPRTRDIELAGRNWAKSFEDLVENAMVTLGNGASEVRVPATWLSQGYQSILALVSDIIGHFFFERGEAVPLDEMEGLVLIDELDLHLHPRWQMKLVPALKRIFPHIQFVATTHSPMILAGAQRDEIVILRQNDQGDVEPHPAPENPQLLTASQIFASFFDVERTEPGRLGAALRQLELLRQADPKSLDDLDRQDMAAFEEKLVSAGIDIERELRSK
jgi:AAA domain, putative AbiEii toxin, Type IV TA system